MQKLLEVAEDYRKVKNYVYERFGGIGSLGKLYPGYTVQNEMTASGLREQLGTPSVYFYLAIYDALGDIKGLWTQTKTKVAKLITKNENFTEEEKHYLRFVMKVNNAFDAVLNQRPMELSKDLQRQYEMLIESVDFEKLNRYLRRQVRKYHGKLHTERADGFSISERAYRYADHGIYISIKEKRKRVFVPLTDQNQYVCQSYIKLYPAECKMEIKVPVTVEVHRHRDYQNRVGIAFGIYTMLTTDEGHCYGEELGKYQIAYSDWMRMQAKSYSRNKKENPGRKKYRAKKQRMEERLHSYINQELNRFLREEKPETVYLVKPPKSQASGGNKRINDSVSKWQRGYIRSRLLQKCKEHSVEIVEVLGKDISNTCSHCGEICARKEWKNHPKNRMRDNHGKDDCGKDSVKNDVKNTWFYCPVCEYQVEEKTNTARNVKQRGQGDGVIHKKAIEHLEKDHRNSHLDKCW